MSMMQFQKLTTTTFVVKAYFKLWEMAWTLHQGPGNEITQS